MLQSAEYFFHMFFDFIVCKSFAFGPESERERNALFPFFHLIALINIKQRYFFEHRDVLFCRSDKFTDRNAFVNDDR